MTALPGQAASDGLVNLADSLFDSVAILQSLLAQIQQLTQEGGIDDEPGLSLSRVVRSVSARVEADASELLDLAVHGADGAAGAAGAVAP